MERYKGFNEKNGNAKLQFHVNKRKMEYIKRKMERLINVKKKSNIVEVSYSGKKGVKIRKKIDLT